MDFTNTIMYQRTFKDTELKIMIFLLLKIILLLIIKEHWRIKNFLPLAMSVVSFESARVSSLLYHFNIYDDSYVSKPIYTYYSVCLNLLILSQGKHDILKLQLIYIIYLTIMFGLITSKTYKLYELSLKMLMWIHVCEFRFVSSW